MEKGRVEGFSDGVFSIVITIMVLELASPANGQWQALLNHEFVATLSAYVTSFLIVTSFWISHHMIFANLKRVSFGMLWLNNLVLLPITLVPFVTAWHGNFPQSPAASVSYGVMYTLTVLALYLLSEVVASHVTEPNHKVRMRHTNQGRLYLSLGIGIPATLLSFWWPPASSWMVLVVSVTWIGRKTMFGLKRNSV